MFSRRVKLFAASLVGLAVVALTAMAWVVLLRRQVRRRTLALEESERRSRGFLEAIPDIRLINRRDGMFIDYQTHETKNLLVPPERFLGRYPADILPPDLAGRFLKTIERTLETGQLQVIEYPLEFAGREQYYELRMVQSGSDEVLSVIREITERKEAEAHLARLAAVVEQTNDDIIFTDREGRITYVNTAFERTTGYAREEVLGKNPDFLQSGLLANEFYDELWAVVLGGNSWTGRFSNRTKGGKVILQDASIFPIRAPEGELVGYVSSQRDVTDQVELQRRLAESQKLEALGTLAGGIAHDFNNILAAIRGYTAFAMTKPLGDPTVRDDLHAVQDASNRATELVKQILSFSRRETQIKRPLMIRPIVKETLHLLRASLPATVDLRPTTFSGTFVVAEPSHIHQIVMNLCTNAAFAMCDTVGAVEIGLDEVVVDNASASRHPDLAPGKFARLRVCDTGCGMTPEVRERIFEPFFTTREEGQGTGLGLSVVHGIVKSLGGAITVQSAPGRGSTFEVYLPAVEGGEEAWKEGEAEYLKGTERILFVDDETMLTDLMAQGLRQLGYRVTACKDGREAWDAFRAAPDDFDVVITDLTMPGTTGDILAREVKRMRPMRPVILCTGYSEKVSSSTPGVDEFVMKPYSMGTLTQLIRKVCSR
jgi:PAS domain S-box-containing protein